MNRTLCRKRVWLFVAVALAVGLGGCNMGPTRPPGLLKAQTEFLGTGIKVIRKDAFPWHNVEFRVKFSVNEYYSYYMDIVDQEDVVIPCGSFLNEDGERYNPTTMGTARRFQIIADEGRWPT